MPISLKKGQKVDLTKTNPGLTKMCVGLGWDINKYDGGSAFDLDTAAFLLGENGKVREQGDFVFYSNLSHASGAVVHQGDNLTGEGEGDDEQIIVDLSKVPADVTRIAFTATIYDAEERRQNFGQVSNAYVRVARRSNKDDMTGIEELKYDLMEEFSIETAIVVCEIYRHGNDWKFNAVGSGYQGGLEALCRSFGVNV